MTGVLFILAGIFTVIGAMSDWGWYWNSWQGRMWVSLFGEGGAKWALGILGAAITLFGFVYAASGQP